MAELSDWDLWRSFLAVLEQGSLSGAARRLGLTQPTLGRHIDALERLCVAALFTRAQDGLTPTELAHALAPLAAEMAASAEALMRTASAELGSEKGVVRLSASEIIGIEVLPAILADLAANHAGLTVELDLSNSHADLLRRDADIAIRMVRPQQDALLATRPGTVGLGLFAHRRYAQAAGLPDDIDALFAHRLIGPDRDLSRLTGYTIDGRALTRDMFSYRVDSDAGQLAALRAGVGIGVCQLGVARRERDLIHVLPRSVSFELEMWLVMHGDLKTSRRVRLTFDHLARNLRNYLAPAG